MEKKNEMVGGITDSNDQITGGEGGLGGFEVERQKRI